MHCILLRMSVSATVHFWIDGNLVVAYMLHATLHYITFFKCKQNTLLKFMMILLTHWRRTGLGRSSEIQIMFADTKPLFTLQCAKSYLETLQAC